MDKGDLRAQVRANRRESRSAADAESWAERGRVFAALALSEPELRAVCYRGGTVASYLSYGGEPPTNELNEALEASGARVLIPVIERNGELFEDLGWAELGAAAVVGRHGVPEPAGPVLGRGAAGLLDLGCAVLILPALAVGRDGSRLGQGGGFYDRVLKQLPRAQALGARAPSLRLSVQALCPIRIALVSPDEVFDSVHTGAHDQPIDRFICA